MSSPSPQPPPARGGGGVRHDLRRRGLRASVRFAGRRSARPLDRRPRRHGRFNSVHAGSRSARADRVLPAHIRPDRSWRRLARHVGRGGTFPCRLGAALRPAVRRDGRDGDVRRHADPRLFDRLHGARCLPAISLLRLPLAVHLLHADAGNGGQPAATVLRLGRRRPLLLPADRLLVRPSGRQRRRDQGVHRQPYRRSRLRGGHRTGLSEIRLGRIRHDLPIRRAASGRHLFGTGRHLPRVRSHRRAAVHRRDGQSRRRSACMSGCPTRWKARRRSPR